MSAPDQSERDRATDITRSVIVQAPAGSGKTTLLVERYLKLLAVVERPEEILAITFTRKAASEMAARVLNALRQASTDPDSSPAAARALAQSDAMGWQLVRHPARLKIQTIDSLALSLTRGLPVAAALNPSLNLTENAEHHYTRAARQLLLKLYDGGPLTEEIADFLRQCDNDAAKAERLVSAMLGKRDQWLDVVASMVSAHQSDPDQIVSVLRRGLEALIDDVIGRFIAALGKERVNQLDQLIDHAGAELGRALETKASRFQLAGEFLTTARGELRKQVTKRDGFSTDHPTEKKAIKEILAYLRDQDLEQLSANLRYLPEERLSDSAVRRLVTVGINLALANSELAQVFSEAGETDFTTLILNARAALGESNAPSELALALDYRISHVLVDEFQDTSVSQFQLFEKLLGGWGADDGNTFFAVGDPMQSIYRFRDADVGLFYRAWTDGIADITLDPVVLTSNFRADAPLVRWVNHAFARIMGDREDPVLGKIGYRSATPTRPGENPDVVQFRQSESPDTQIANILARIEALLAEPEGTIALLVRSRGQLTQLIRALRARGISWRANDIDPLLDRPAVSDLLALIGALSDPYDRLSWMSLLRAPFIGLRISDLQLLAGVEDYPAFLEALREQNVQIPLSADAFERLRRLAAGWPLSRTIADELPTRSIVETTWLKLGGADAYADPAALTHAERLLTLLDSLGPASVSLEALRQAGQSLFAADLSESRLEILTVHKAKGLEFDHVLLPFLERTTRSDESELLLWRALPEGLLMGVQEDDGPFEWLKRENRYRERHERQRLFYVACTRAKQSLTLFASMSFSDKPPDTAMLSLLWPQLTSTDVGELLIQQMPEESLPVQPDLFVMPEPEDDQPPLLKRLVSGYQWQPPETSTLAERVATEEVARQDPLEARMEVILGIVVHGALEQLAQTDIPGDLTGFIADYMPGARRLWHAMASEHELSAEDVELVVNTAAQQISQVLGHAEGRWVLEARPDARSELALTGVVEGGIQNLVIDRTFTDPESGERWVVDFKTAIPHPGISEDVFIRTETNRYRPQLERYGLVATALFDQPVRLALYFTALPKLVEL